MVIFLINPPQFAGIFYLAFDWLEVLRIGLAWSLRRSIVQ